MVKSGVVGDPFDTTEYGQPMLKRQQVMSWNAGKERSKHEATTYSLGCRQHIKYTLAAVLHTWLF